MKKKISTLWKEAAFVMLLFLGGIALAHAQEERSEKKVKVEIEITEDGKTTTTTREIEIDPENVDARMEEMIEEIEMVLEEAVQDLEHSDVEVIINKRRAEDGSFFTPHYRHRMRTAPASPHSPLAPRPMSDRIAHRSDRPFLGVVAEGLSLEECKELKIDHGARIERVIEGSAAEKAGLQEGDVLLEVEKDRIVDHATTAKAIRAHEVGEEITIRYLRDGKRQRSKVTLGSFDPMRGLESYSDNREAFREGQRVYEKRAKRMEELRALERKVFLGIEGSDREEGGVTISKVFEESSAEAMGIKIGDHVLTLNNDSIENISDLVMKLNEYEPGDAVKVTLKREEEELVVNGSLRPFPEDLRSNVNSNSFQEMQWESTFPSQPHKRHVFRFEMRDLTREEIQDLNKRSGQELDEANALEMEHFMISPNPSDGVFVIDGIPAEKGDAKIIVLDANGKLVTEKLVKVEDEGVLKRIDLSKEEAGMYFISIQQNGKGKTTRVIKR